VSVAFRVDQGANPFYFDVLVEFEGGDGDLKAHGAQLGRDVAPQQRQEAQGAVRAPAHLRLRQDPRRQRCHPGHVEGRETYRSQVIYP
jgi:hypothetical protein